MLQVFHLALMPQQASGVQVAAGARVSSTCLLALFKRNLDSFITFEESSLNSPCAGDSGRGFNQVAGAPSGFDASAAAVFWGRGGCWGSDVVDVFAGAVQTQFRSLESFPCHQLIYF